MFYNVENYFDTINNPLTQDEFTPNDVYEWTHERFIKKRNAIARVITDINVENLPDIIGLCEIENYYVLQQLINSTTLRRYDYSILHHDSPDTRGIDVALLYNNKRLYLLDSLFFLMGNEELNKQKREILYAKALIDERDTVHIFVSHFPSKRDGARKTAPLRMSAAQALRKAADSILMYQSQANILMMGDFNDTYKSETLTQGLQVNFSYTNISNTKLYNVSALLAEAGDGSIKYRNRWQLVDMFLVSGNLLNPNSDLYCKPSDTGIFMADHLLEYVPAANSYRPKATYRWINYIGGYSDHLPIYMKIYRK
jgi:predicted extracellular nuclease